MARSARDKPKEDPPKPPPAIGDKRTALRSMRTGRADVPVRTVIYVEVGDVPAPDVRGMVKQIEAVHGNPFHPTFIIPVRHGKLTGDVLFEAEILDLVNKICEVKDGAIAMRGGHTDVEVVRTSI